MKVVKHTRLTCVRSIATNTYRKKEVETGSGKEGGSWNYVENDG